MAVKKVPYNFMVITAILLVCILNYIQGDPVVETKLGKVRGTTLTSDNGQPFFAFRGIPFAKPPVKQLRFKPPVPVDKWQDTLDATENGHSCIQLDVLRHNLITGDEDCLFLNVYTKQLTTSNLRPVMVFIHGGGFTAGEGSSHLYGPERLLDKDIVLVTINYRLSALGFLSTEDAESPGNYGLLDQVEALKWVQNHVENFGGDPKSVTIFGESAGSASVTYHLISPLSKGLFHGAIAQSGSATSPWALQREPLNQAKQLAESLNCPTDNNANLVSCLRKRAALDVMIKSSFIEFSNPMITNPRIPQFQPVVDKGLGASVEFLPEDPKSLLKNHQINKVPVIIGNVKDEGYIFILMVAIRSGPDNLEKEQIFKLLQTLNEGYDSDTLEKLSAGYFTNVDESDVHQKIKTFSDMVGDVIMNADVDITVNAIAASGVPTYAYQLTYSGENSISSFMGSFLKEDYAKTLKLVPHADDLQYLFRLSLIQNNLNEQDKLIADKMVTLWTNFAKNKVPSLDGGNVDDESFEWNPVEPNQETQYLNIGDKLRMEEGALSARPDLWKEHLMKDEL